jgi:hypothetical protein
MSRHISRVVKIETFPILDNFITIRFFCHVAQRQTESPCVRASGNPMALRT